MLKYLIVFIIPIIYFLLLWMIPWQEIEFLDFINPISQSVFFDVIFIIFFFYILKVKNFMGIVKLRTFSLRTLFVFIFAILCISLSNLFGLNSPFKHLELLFLELLIVAPVLEELVFRGVFLSIGERSGLHPKANALFNSILFSISHAPALWFISNEFHSFIGFQLFYTLILGFVCAQSRISTKGILAPIGLHFIFNFVFYVAVKLGML